MLFNYQLKPISDCTMPETSDGKKRIAWFWLTDSFFHIDLGEVKLYETSPESIDKYKLSSPYNDYYYIRFLEDFFDILPPRMLAPATRALQPYRKYR